MRRSMRYFLMIVGLTLSMGVFAQTTKWRDIYTVKKKDTVFGIANKYGLSLPELMEANPEMKQEGYVLQKGATLFIPYEKDLKKNQEKAGNAAGASATAATAGTGALAPAKSAAAPAVVSNAV